MKSPKILVIDDDIFVGRMIKALLTSDGYDVVTAVSGKEALEKIKQTYFDLILTDWKMGELDGIIVLMEIKKIFPTLPVILISGYLPDELKEQALRAGAQSCLDKPCNYDILRREIERGLSKAQKTKE